ncbi:pili assembly chaperone protein SafB, partial [Salmonella enterica subsp. enterica serovar Corvallis]
MKTINFVLMAVALFASNSMVSVYAARQQLNSATKSFSVKLGATRVIYHAGTPGAT